MRRARRRGEESWIPANESWMRDAGHRMWMRSLRVGCVRADLPEGRRTTGAATSAATGVDATPSESLSNRGARVSTTGSTLPLPLLSRTAVAATWMDETSTACALSRRWMGDEDKVKLRRTAPQVHKE
jgi:hypothetical protein